MAEVFSPVTPAASFGFGGPPHRRRRFHHEVEGSPELQSQSCKRFRPENFSFPSNNTSSSPALFNFPQNSNKRSRADVGTESGSHGFAKNQNNENFQAEIENLRFTLSKELEAKEASLSQFKIENASLQNQLAQFQHELQRIQEENKILKKAVNLQNSKAKESEQTIKMQEATLVQAVDHIKKLEQTNYALRIHLENSKSTPLTFDQRPPDVF
uniref:Uncharacterized protein n=1 Tax=Heterosigma akashiwo TaxID=2829 RepID=A0A6V1NE11_HETAK|mmetsp:Transcript_58301/g.85282  ORF Transcript_58301/g.85282 Transcript_58301/m.85282 type:complete len:213 (-) Transcript_58301:465-1103(-)|eukprot:CAMPEP_0194570138 /NCGR_PEP_ID=MMETSP0292-20121207/7571_1 /TAXON_ID=39354 /ORGANISM="Heterosigma akashiwo, Strain CCMP2393" /LENGTH=212 /DNA_ID=CAMNT_0039420523 /DNA_START=95 /DNA_END=733 /DNA_ORIENTATION=-